MDKAIKDKLVVDVGPETQRLFKLKRFQEVEPRTSTKRGVEPFMLKTQHTTLNQK